jgi:hypothetical protein
MSDTPINTTLSAEKRFILDSETEVYKTKKLILDMESLLSEAGDRHNNLILQALYIDARNVDNNTPSSENREIVRLLNSVLATAHADLYNLKAIVVDLSAKLAIARAKVFDDEGTA